MGGKVVNILRGLELQSAAARGASIPKLSPQPLDWRSSSRQPVTLFLVATIFTLIYYVGVKGERRSAFNRWRPALARLVDGRNIYASADAFPTPPIMGLVLYPFSRLPPRIGMAAWFLLKVGLTVLAFRWILQMIGGQGLYPPWLIGAMLALSLRPILGDLLHGNVNLWVMFWIIATVFAASKGQPGLAGLALGVAIASKLTPVLLLGYFAWKRQARLCLATVSSLFLCLVILPGICLGFEHNRVLLREWASLMIRPYLIDGSIDHSPNNQSLPALVARWTSGLDIDSASGEARRPVNGSDKWLPRALTAILLVGLAIVCWPRPGPMTADRFPHEVGLVLLAMLLFSERSWKHHYCILLFNYSVLLADGYRFWLSPVLRHRGFAIAALVAGSTILTALGNEDFMSHIFGAGTGESFQFAGVFVWAALILAAAHGVGLWRREGAFLPRQVGVMTCA